MIISKRMKIRRNKVDSTQLLDYLNDYFKNNVDGQVLRFAITGMSGRDMVVDVSIIVQGSNSIQKKRRASHG